jgi:hypothetical protein
MLDALLSNAKSSREIGGSQRIPKKWNTVAEESTASEAVTGRRPVKTQQTENNWCVL